MASGGLGGGRKPWLGREIFGQPPRPPDPLPEPRGPDRSEYAARAVEELRAAASLMSESQRVANFGSWEWRVREDLVTWSDQLYRIFGLDRATFKATLDAYIAHTHPEEREFVRSRIQAAAEGQRKFRFEHRILRPGGEERIVRCHGEPILGERGEVERVLGVCQDITEFAQVEQERDEADARFRSAFEHAPIGIALIDFDEGPEGRLTQVNRALCELTGRGERELIGSTLVSLALGEDAELDRALRERLVARDIGRYTIEKRALLDDRLIWLEFSVSTLEEHDQAHTHGIVQVQDVTERKRAEEQLRYVADHDSLTGLVNRRRFRQELDSHLALLRRYGGEGALLVIDVDRLKTINDTRGHGAGDLVLGRIAEVMRTRMRSTDVIGRLAGDEFAVLLPSVDADHAAKLAKELIARLAAEEIAGANVSVSIGVAPFNGETVESAEQVTAAADVAMYRAKQRGGGVAEIAGAEWLGVDPEGGPRRSQTMPLRDASAPDPTSSYEAPEPPPPPRPPTLAERVRAALDGGDLLIYAQPAVDLRGGGLAHRELLVRMRDEAGDVLAASEFLTAAAEEPGLCAEIDRWVVARALGMLANGSAGARLQVNLSDETLTDRRSLDELVDLLHDAPGASASLALEISEGAVERDVESASAALDTLASTGCPLVLDSFSAGFGSFEYLQRLPLDQIKFDGAVVGALLGEQPDHATVRAVVRLAHGTGTSTVAKLVESQEVLPILRMHGVDMAQGFELGEPALLAG